MPIKPLVSIGVATWNRANVISKALESVLWQTYPNWECIISDDDSTDNTKEVVMGYVKKDKRFKYINKGKSEYYTINRNRCFEEAKGDLYCFRDDDGVWEPDFLEEMIKPFSNPDVVIAYCGRIVHYEVDLPNLDLSKLNELPNTEEIPLRQFIGDTAVLNGVVDVGDLMVKAEAFKKVDGFSKEKDKPGYCSDMVLIDNILANYPYGKIVMVPKRLHHYFLDWKGGRKQMTIEKLEYRQKTKKAHPTLEKEWIF